MTATQLLTLRDESRQEVKNLLVYINIVRMLLILAVMAYFFFWSDVAARPGFESEYFLKVIISYLMVALAAALFQDRVELAFEHKVGAFVVADIIFIVLLIYAAGGLSSGLGLLLVMATVAASLFTKGLQAIFYAALATIALLLEQTYEWLNWPNQYTDFNQAAMVAMSCFATAWLGHVLAKRTMQSEALASQRGVDLENMEQVNALITQEMQDGVLVIDKAGILRHYNMQAEILLGKQHLLYLSQPLMDLVPEMSDVIKAWFKDGVEIQGDSFNVESEGRQLRLRVMPVGDAGREGAVMFIEDWSQVQMQSQQLKLAALGRLTANIAHEIRNPLSAISHASQLMQEEDDLPPANKRMLEIISDNVMRLDQIVKDVLELGRRDRTKQERINLNDFLREFHQQYCEIEKIEPKNFTLRLPTSTVYVTFDQRHLNQIFWNLCRNGWRHCQKKESSLMLAAEVQDESYHVTIHVTDDGPGVSPNIIAHLFEPFFTTESTGTGLGLYIAGELCDANGGDIEYEALETGCRFSVTIKREAAS